MSQKYNVPKWEINGERFPFDYDDMETIERYKRALAQMGEDSNTVIVTGDRSDIIKSHYEIFSKVFDTVFGPGTSEKIFKGKVNLRMCFDAFDSMVGFVNSCKRRSEANYNQRLQKYMPENKAHKRNRK